MIGDNYIADVPGANQIGIKAILVRKENDHKYEFYSEDLIGAIKIIESQQF